MLFIELWVKVVWFRKRNKRIATISKLSTFLLIFSPTIVLFIDTIHSTQLFNQSKSLLPDVLPLQKPRNNPRRAGHERRGHHARHRRSVPHIRGAACLRVPVPALEAEVHQVRWWQMSVRLAEETSHVTVELSFRNSIERTE